MTATDHGPAATRQQLAYNVGPMTDVGPDLYRDSDSIIDRYPHPVITRAELDRRDPILWPVLTGVLSEHPPTVELVARALAASVMPGWWDQISPHFRDHYRQQARAVLAALRTPRAVLIVGRTRSQCSACGRNADPCEQAHLMAYMAGEGCGARFVAVAPDNTGIGEADVRAMGLTLPWTDVAPTPARQTTNQDGAR